MMINLFIFFTLIGTTLILIFSFLTAYLIVSYYRKKLKLEMYFGYFTYALALYLISTVPFFIQYYFITNVGVAAAKELFIDLGGVTLISFGLKVISFSLIAFGGLRTIIEMKHNDLELGKRWNWLAFLFCPIWSLFNGRYWGLVSIIPGFGIVISVYFAIFSTQYDNACEQN